MNKIISTIAAVAILGVAAQAQFGVKLGLGMASVHGDSDIEKYMDESILSPIVGVTYHLTLGPVGVKPEILLEKKGGKGSVFGTDLEMDYWFIDAPLLGSFSILPTLSIIAGPSIGYLLSADYKQGSETEDVKDEMKSINYGAVAGVQFMLPIAGLGIDARYQYGFTNMSKNSDDPEISTDLMAVTATYLF